MGGRLAALGLLCLLLLFACACAGEGAPTAVCNGDAYAAYPEAVARLLPGHEIRRADNQAFTYLEQEAVAEAFDAQAIPALAAGAARYWYPQYLATVVIAVDRGRTQAEIKGWRDLLRVSEAVGFSDSNVNLHLLTAAMAYGLEGGHFTLNQAAALLARLQAARRLAQNSFEPPVVICYDYQAAALLRAGKNIEMVVPAEGTLTYEKGLLSKRPLEFRGDANALLYAAGLRLRGGACDPALYGSANYAPAVHLRNFSHLNTVCQDVIRVYRRTVLRVRLYSSADGREHQLAALLYMALVVAWTAALVRRAMQKGVRRAALAIGVILIGWMAVRLLKYQLVFAVGLDRYLWYCFYLFQLALPLVLLWLAWTIDQPDDKANIPRWMGVPAAICAALAALVFTNDLHHWVFRLDRSYPAKAIAYGYGPGYYLVVAACVLMVLSAVAVMMHKSRQSPRKRGFIYPIALGALLLVYGLGYVLRVPFAWESDITMVTGLFTLLALEASVRAGMIPANTKYRPLFTHSPLAMQIADGEGTIALSSANLLREDENTLHFAAPIAGGTARWQEDISALNQLHREMEEQTRMLATANAILAEEERMRRRLEEENARTQLITQLESEIAAHTARLTEMVERGESAARIVLLLCYIKRRCNLFFRERETRLLPADELAVYIDELAELAGYANVMIITTNQRKEPLELRRATLFYDFFYQAVDFSAGAGNRDTGVRHMLAHLGPEESLRILASEDIRAAGIASPEGTIVIKDLDGAVGISLRFPEGGNANG